MGAFSPTADVGGDREAVTAGPGAAPPSPPTGSPGEEADLQ